MFERAEILGEMLRLAEANGGVPLGRQRFEEATGTQESDWLGRYCKLRRKYM